MSTSLSIRLLTWALPALWLAPPVSYFTDEDWKRVRHAIQLVVDSKESRPIQRWKNPINRHAGQVSVLESFKSKEGRPCRVLRLDSTVQGLSGSMRYTLCQDEAGVWRDVESGTPFTEVPAAERVR